MSTAIRAAGGVLWRATEADGVEVALIHRPRYDDWSLPKGKAEPDEHLVDCALREVWEETGQRAVLGRGLGRSRYFVMGSAGPARKTVTWWSMRAVGGTFEPSREVDRMVWLSSDDALQRIGAGRGRGPLRRFAQAPPGTQILLLVSSGHAVSATSWPGEDMSRPLDNRGSAQASRLSRLLTAYRPDAISSAPPVRCVATVSPSASQLDVPVDIEPALTRAAHDANPARSHARVAELVEAASITVVCSEPLVVRDLIRGLTGRAAAAGPASIWALSFSDRNLVGSDYWPG